MQLTRRSVLSTVALASAATMIAVPTVGCSTEWIATAQKDLPIIADIVTSLAGVALTASGNGALTPAAYAAIKTGLTAAQAGLLLLNTTLADIGNKPDASMIAKIDTTLADITKNLNTILPALRVDNTGLISTITTGLALALSTVASIQLLIPAPVSANSFKKAQAQSSVATKLALPAPEALKTLFNTVCVSNGYVSAQVK